MRRGSRGRLPELPDREGSDAPPLRWSCIYGAEFLWAGALCKRAFAYNQAAGALAPLGTVSRGSVTRPAGLAGALAVKPAASVRVAAKAPMLSGVCGCKLFHMKQYRGLCCEILRAGRGIGDWIAGN
jgi:hypothetical protein